ncbi:MAG TPA: hypothetical protein VHL55_04540, partial [Acidimicrobiia bacterium]|nr:hypothetical protein [Acidimicrobiia bacterium]
MSTVHRDRGRAASRQLITAGALSLCLSIGLVATSTASTTTLSAPPWWPWLLTGLQVLALWSAGRGS